MVPALRKKSRISALHNSLKLMSLSFLVCKVGMVSVLLTSQGHWEGWFMDKQMCGSVLERHHFLSQQGQYLKESSNCLGKAVCHSLGDSTCQMPAHLSPREMARGGV